MKSDREIIQEIDELTEDRSRDIIIIKPNVDDYKELQEMQKALQESQKDNQFVIGSVPC